MDLKPKSTIIPLSILWTALNFDLNSSLLADWHVTWLQKMKQFTVAISLLTTTRPRKGEEMKIYVSKSVSKHYYLYIFSRAEQEVLLNLWCDFTCHKCLQGWKKQWYSNFYAPPNRIMSLRNCCFIWWRKSSISPIQCITYTNLLSVWSSWNPVYRKESEHLKTFYL